MFEKFKQTLSFAKTHYGIGLNMAMTDFTNSFNSLFVDREFFDADFFEELEEKLIELDILPNLAINLTMEIEKEILNKRANPDTFNEALFSAIKSHANFKEVNKLELDDKHLNILLVVGINGVGKTTTISKLANMYKGLNIELVAADTFRAGAIDQLDTWATRLNVPITKTHQGHAPSAVIFQGMESAIANKRELLICDTAGRLHNKENLMDELNKIHKVIENQALDNEYNLKTVLVLDGTSGKNTIEQAKAFNAITNLDGVIVTKMDSQAKVGSIINISYELDVPIFYLTNGEAIEDIVEFDPDSYLSMLFNEKAWL